MNYFLKGANIVVLANKHNPTIASKEWATQKGIITEEIKNFTHTPVFSLIETENFIFVVDPDRLQISVKKTLSQNLGELPNIVKRYIEQLPETPYLAIGLNFIYHLNLEKGLEGFFSPNTDKFKKIFSEPYQIGGTIRFKFENFLVRLNIQPTKENNKFIGDFNFHCDTEKLEEMKKILGMYFKVKDKAESILKELTNG